MTDKILDLSIAKLAARLRAGELTSVDIVNAAIERHSDCDESLGAYRRWLPNQALALAREADQAFKAGHDHGPLQGIPVSIKDLYGWSATDTQAGSPLVLPASWNVSGPVVNRLLEQHAAITGKTHTVEFAFGGLGVNHHLGTPRNPWDGQSHRVPGGSSSGAGVSLQCGSALIALGTDTGGSVRIPAALTGNAGLKTTAGRWSLDGIVPLSPTLDTPGPLARNMLDLSWAFAALDPQVDDAAALLKRTEDFALSGLRMAIADDALWTDLDAGIEDTVELALQELVKAGASKQKIDMPEVSIATDMHRQGSIASAELDEFLLNELPECRDKLHPIIASRVRDGGDISAREFLGRKRQLARITRSARQYFNEVDVIVSPTVAITAPTMDEVDDIDEYRKFNFKSLRNTNVANCLGLCALTIPVGLDSKRMPVGLQLMAAADNEEQLLAIGRACETVLGSSRERLGIATLVQ